MTTLHFSNNPIFLQHYTKTYYTLQTRGYTPEFTEGVEQHETIGAAYGMALDLGYKPEEFSGRFRIIKKVVVATSYNSEVMFHELPKC